ncbi:MAG: hypothetical protein U1C74_11060 [Phenylobacterium sp.]|nr:hypothetical protein [Phenylobacterium sp.]
MARQPAKTKRRSAPAALDTPVLEWIAASAGAVLTLAVLGYSVWEGVRDTGAPPDLRAEMERATPGQGGFVTPIVVINASYKTAADVEVIARLEVAGQPPETRRARLAYVPGQGEARAGVIFQGDPATGRVTIEVDGYEEP